MLVTMKARKLDNVDVSFVSLVERGANRIPFRIIKNNKEEGMKMDLDLGAIFRTKKAEIPAPTVAAVVVSKGKVDDALIAKLEKGGFVKQEADEDAAQIIFKSADYDETAAIVAMNEDVAVVLDTVQKSFYSWSEGSSFEENMAKSSFFPSYEMAEEVLEDTVRNIMYGDDISPTDKAASIATAIDAFKAYVMALATSLPASAFEMAKYVWVEVDEGVSKAEGAEAVSAAESDEPAAETVVKDEAGEVEHSAEESEAATVAKAEDTPGDEEDGAAAAEDAGETVAKSESEKPAAEAATDKPEEETVVKSEATDVDKILKSIQTLSSTVGEMSETLEGVVRSQQDLGERVEKAEATVDSAQEALEETVIAGSLDGESEAVTAKKAEQKPDEVFAGSALDKLTS